MKGLLAIPTIEDLKGAYEELQEPGRALAGPERVALLSQWARLDPRLAEILVHWLSARWAEIPAEALRSQLLGQPWPAALGVLLEFARIQAQDRVRFDYWMKGVLADVPKGSGELFFIGQRAPGGKLMREDARWSLEPYRRWGYLGREVLINKSARLQGQLTLVSPEVRALAIAKLTRTRERFTLRDYQDLLGGWVSRRQAERDLREAKGLRAVGNTRARYYVRR